MSLAYVNVSNYPNFTHVHFRHFGYKRATKSAWMYRLAKGNQPVKEMDPEETRFLCHYCGQRFKNQNCRDNHTQSVHRTPSSKKNAKISIHQKPSPSWLLHCEETENYISPEGNAKKAVETKVEAHRKIQVEVPKEHQCDICHRTFAYRTSLQRHKGHMHADPRKLFLCKVCGKQYLTIQGLAKHQQIQYHDDKQPRLVQVTAQNTETKIKRGRPGKPMMQHTQPMIPLGRRLRGECNAEIS